MTSAVPIFACADLEATLDYYRDVVGFKIDWTYGEPANFGSASRGGVTIMFSQHPKLAARSAGQSIWVKVDDADVLYAEHIKRGAKVVEEIGDRPWGVREYVVEDPNGYRIRLAGPPSSEAPPSQPFPEEVTIETRKPTPEEFVRVTTAAFGNDGRQGESAAVILDRTWDGVVAVSPVGSAVGLLRIMADAPGWYSVWDVAVDPAWQARRIGSKMMEAAMARVAEADPGSFVFLFTFKHGFYEKLGFKLESVTMRRV